MNEQNQKNEMSTQDWYQSLTEDCSAIVTEAEFTSRWSLIEGYHELGRRLSEERENLQGKKKELMKQLSKELKKSERTLYYTVQFYEAFPDLALLPEGKNISWHSITSKYLGREKRKRKPKTVKCPKCGEYIKE